MPREQIHVFFDESGTSPGDEYLLVGAVAFHDVNGAESDVKAAYDRAIGSPHLWSDDEGRAKFSRTGFHHTADSEPVKQVLLDAMTSLDFRAYAAYSGNPAPESNVERMVSMYGLLMGSLSSRYRDCEIVFVFEENSDMDRLYARIWGDLLDEDGDDGRVTILRGNKKAPCLCVVDYVLGITRIHLGSNEKAFQGIRFAGLGTKWAYLIDFDNDKHFGDRKRPIL